MTVADLTAKLGRTREKGITELFFVSARGEKQESDVPQRVEKEFSNGQNLYVFNLTELASSALALVGLEGRRDFLIAVGDQLDQYSDTKHRLAWKKTLEVL